MSHYRKDIYEVVVFRTPTSPSVDELLSPYNEETGMVEPHLYWSRSEAILKARSATNRAKHILDRRHGKNEDGLVELASHLNDSDDDLLSWFATECDLVTDDEGNLMSTYGSNARWNRYRVIETCSLKEWIRRWGSNFVDMTDDEIRTEWPRRSRKLPHVAALGDAETYVAYCRMPWYDGPIVTPDGRWYETPPKVSRDGKLAIWTDEELDWIRHFDERFIAPYDLDETMVSSVDCVTYNGRI